MSDVEIKQELTDQHDTPALSSAPAETDNVSPGSSTQSSHTYNVFVGDLAPSITESQLRDHFIQYGEIKLVNIIRDKVTGACKGYAFIHFAKQDARERALAPENSSPIIGGQAARVKPSDEKTVLQITNVPSHFTYDVLLNDFTHLLGGITSSFNLELRMPGVVILSFKTFDVANMAKKALMNAPLGGKQITATWAEAGSRQMVMPVVRTMESDPLHVTTLHISNIAMTVTEEDLRNLFARFGEVSRPVIVKNALGEKRGFGFVTLPDRDACMAAMRELDQTEFQGQRIGVALAKSTSGSATSTIGAGRDGRGAPRGGRAGPDRQGRFDRDNRGNDRYNRQGPYGSAPPSYGNYPGPTPSYGGYNPSYPPYGAYPPSQNWPSYPYDPNASAGSYGAPPSSQPPPYSTYPPYDPNTAYYGSQAQPPYGTNPPPSSQPSSRYY